MSGDHDLHTLAGAYVLDAVAPDERARFAAHLADCAECRQDVRELREATARLGTAAALRPRPELRDQTIQAASRISQVGPVMPNRADGKGGSRQVTSARSWLTFPRLALAAAIVVIAGAVGVLLAGRGPAGPQQDISSVLKAPDAVMLTAKISTGGMATVVVSHREHMGVFMAHDLPALPAAKRYELWLMGPRGVRPAGMLRTRRGGMAGPALLVRLRPGDKIALTVEPASGSPYPTSATLVLIGPNSRP
jgi:anti-sigma-K factor RskA